MYVGFSVVDNEAGIVDGEMRLLDLFCGAGGAAMGYHRAGFEEIVGVDAGVAVPRRAG